MSATHHLRAYRTLRRRPTAGAQPDDAIAQAVS